VFLKELKEAEDGDAREERERRSALHTTPTLLFFSCSAISVLRLAQRSIALRGVLKQQHTMLSRGVRSSMFLV
jgi:hypothetical protein